MGLFEPIQNRRRVFVNYLVLLHHITLDKRCRSMLVANRSSI